MKLLGNLLFAFIILFQTKSYSQLSPIGSWTDHLPYRFGTSIAKGDGVIFCGTKSGLFSYDYNDNSITRFSKVNILNDVGIEKIKYSEETNSLVIVYKSLNIDILSKDNVVNIPFIKTSSEEGTINEIKIEGNLAYMSFTFGIVVLDLVKLEIKDTYKFGLNGGSINVYSTEKIGNLLYAATDNGYYKASINSNLLDFNSWNQQPFKRNTKIALLGELNNDLVIVSEDPPDLDSLFIEQASEFKSINEFNQLKKI